MNNDYKILDFMFEQRSDMERFREDGKQGIVDYRLNRCDYACTMRTTGAIGNIGEELELCAHNMRWVSEAKDKIMKGVIEEAYYAGSLNKRCENCGHIKEKGKSEYSTQEQ